MSLSTYENIWGIYNADYEPVLADVYIDSMIDLKYTNASKISTFPVEEGSFVSYNKVQTPYKAKVRMSVGGNDINIAAFIKQLDALVMDTKLYSIVTPQKTYLNANIEKIDYTRSQNKGVNLIMADIELIEIRQVSPSYGKVALPPAKAKKPQDVSKKNNGKNQTQPRVDYAKYSPEEIVYFASIGQPVGTYSPKPKVP